MEGKVVQGFIGEIGEVRIENQDLYFAVLDTINLIEDEYKISLPKEIVPCITDFILEACDWRINYDEISYMAVADKSAKIFLGYPSTGYIQLNHTGISDELKDKFYNIFKDVNVNIEH